MTQHEKNIHQKIKSKLDAHEFDFNPQSWENMEQLLDGRTPNKSYLLTKIIIAMMTGLFLLWLLLWTQDAPNVSPNSDSAEVTTGLNSDLSNFENLSNQPAEKTIQTLQSQLVQTPAALSTQPQNHPSSLIPHSLLDTSFFEKIAAKLALFNRHYAPEKVYLQFDRTFFEPGEAIWFNAYLRDANSLKASTKSEILQVELLAPNGSVLKKISLLAKGGTAAGDFQLDKTASGGMYKIKAYTNWQLNTGDVFERDIQVQATVLPRLRMELDFLREAYGSGDRAEAKLDLNTLANQPLSNHEFTATVSLDGQRFTEVKGRTNGSGHTRIKFDLPKNLTTNDGLLNVLIQYNGQTESISRSVPIVLNKIDLQFLPEGGDMVAGLPGTVAFKALNEFGKPADVEGEIFNSKGLKISSFRSYHQGMGAFDLLPEPGETYHARLTKPEGISEKFGLPDAYPRGFTLRVTPSLIPHPSFLKNDSLQVEISSTENEPLNIALVSNGEIYFTQTLPALAGSHRVKIPTATLPIGIAQVTLFDSREIPRAERLVFLNPHKKLNVSILTNKEKYLPREKVEMTVKVTDERGLPMPGRFSLAVADDNLLTFADDKQGHILAHLLLESDLTGKVEEPNFYFDKKEKHPEKNQLLALDYLMMTQGWRRFGWDKILWEPPVAMQFDNEKAVMIGQVLDYQNRPIPNLEVKIDGTNHTATTDEQGRFTLDTLFAWTRFMIELNGKPQYTGDFSNVADSRNPVIRVPFNHSPNSPRTTAVILKDPLSADYAILQGTVTDDETGEPIVFGSVAAYKNGILVTGTQTDFNGFYNLTELEAGKYDLVFSYTGYNDSKVESIQIAQNKAYRLNANMTSGVQLQEVVVAYSRPLIERDNTTQGSVRTFDRPKASAPSSKSASKKSTAQLEVIQPDNKAQKQTLTAEQIKNLPTRDVNAMASMSAGVASADDARALNIRGSRSDATNYYIDGVRVQGQPGGVPAQFGNQKEMEDARVEEQVVSRDQSIQEEAKVGLLKKKSASSPPPPPSWTASAAPNFQTIHHPRQFYAPKYDTSSEIPNPKSEIPRTDFRKTVFWEPNLTVGRNGTATVEFYNSDAITTFRATVEGLGLDGSIGRGEQRFFTQMPFGMDVKIPTNLLTGDRLVLPLTLANNTDEAISGKLTINTPAGFSLVKQLPETLTLKAGETTTIYPEYKVGFEAKTGALQVAFQAEGFSDAFAERVDVQPRGFPVAQVFGGSALEQTFNFEINDPIEGSLQAALTVHPSVLSDLTSGMERMLRQPNGCFEQTSSSNYPNVLVLNYLKTTGNAASNVEKQANDFLDFGYKRLLTFEVPGGGFDWYGKPPAHEALTAYGLMEFTDMQQVYPVEQDLINRTAKWLLSRRDGNGGWSNGRPGLHSWKQQSAISDAYIAWAVTEAGLGKQISPEIEKTVRDANETEDPYIMALAVNILIKMNDRRAGEMLKKLAALQNADGSWTGKTHSMTHSTGQNLTVETTGLAMLAFLQKMTTSAQAKSDYTRLTENAVKYLATAKSPYGFGSTQATILALKALVKHAGMYRQGMSGGTVAVVVNGKKVEERPFTANQNEPIVFDQLTPHFTEGKNSVQVRFSGTDTPLPCDLTVAYNTRQPHSSPDCLLDFSTKLATGAPIYQSTNSPIYQTKTGETVRLTTTLANRSDAPVANPIAIVGIPAGLSVQPWQVKEMQEKTLFDFYEIKDGYVIFYFRELDGKEVKTIHLDLKADLPGTYEAPASSAYLYYSNDAVVWSKPERVVVETGH